MPRRAFLDLSTVVAGALLVCFLAAKPEISPPEVNRSSPSSVSRRRDAQVLEVLKAVNELREGAGLKRLTVHPELQIALDDFTQEGMSGGLEGAFRFAGARIPTIHELAGNLVYGAGDELIMRELERWTDVLDPAHTHLAVQFFDDQKRGRSGCIAVLASTFPEFRPPMNSAGVSGFFDVCRWCGRGHGISVAGGGQTTLVIQCPDCRRTCDLVATDSNGYWRRVTQFLHRGHSVSPAAGMTEVMAIWMKLTTKNRYQRDAERIGGGDSWNLPAETLRRGTGDCEDTSLLLAQLLLDRGYEARVVLGKHRGQGHAWCVLRLEGQSYLLESTTSRSDLDRPPLISECALDYEPEYQFDADRMYFKGFEGWTGEYWSDAIWSGAEAQRWMSAAL